MSPRVAWRGASNRLVDMQACQIDWDWVPAQGLYIFATPISQESWRPLYVGQTDNLKRRMSEYRSDQNGKWFTALRQFGNVFVHAVLTFGNENDRKLIEQDLIARLNPPLNVVLRPAGLSGLRYFG